MHHPTANIYRQRSSTYTDEIETLILLYYKGEVVIYFCFLAFSFYDIMLMNERLSGFSFRLFVHVCARRIIHINRTHRA